MNDKYLSMIRMFERKEELDYVFPNEHLGVADRCIYNRVIREVAKKFKDNDPNGRVYVTAHLCFDTDEAMRKFGFKVKKMSTDC